MILSDLAIRRPVAMTTALLVMLLFGALAYRNLGVDLMPQVDVPFVTVVTVYPGASPDEIESTVARKIEDAVGTIDGINHVHSVCMESVCQTLIEFNLGIGVDFAAMDVREKIGLVRNDLPDAVEEPQILKYDINAQPVVTLALTGSLPRDALFDYADNELKDRLSRLEGVASVEITGGSEREVRVRLLRERLAARGLTSLDVVRALSEGHVQIPVGELKEGGQEFSLTFDGESDRVEELGDLPLKSPDGQRLYLRDIATIGMEAADLDTAAFLDGAPCIALKIVKKGDANAVRVVDLVRGAVAEVRDELPGGMALVWFRDDGDFVRASVRDAWSSILQGILLTSVILVLFLQDLRTALVAAISMPTSIVASFAGLGWFGYTLNMSTLLAFGISVGTLVTNSIMVIESIVTRVARHGDPVESVRLGTGEVASAVLASGLTNVIVFVPVALMNSMAGLMLAPFAVTMAIATLVSLFISFTLTPILSAFFLKRESRFNHRLERLLGPWLRIYSRIESGYGASLRRLAPHPGVAVLVLLVVLVGGLAWLVPRIGMDFTSIPDRGEIALKLEYPAGSNLGETSRRAEAVSARLRARPEVQRSMTIVGKVQGVVGQVSEGHHLAEIMLEFKPKTERRETLEQLRKIVRDELKDEPGCIYSAMIPLIGGSSKMLEAEISGSDLGTLNRIGTEASRRMAALPQLVDIEDTVRIGKPEIRVLPRRAVLHDLGAPAASLGLALRGGIEGLVAATYKAGDRSYDIRVSLAEEQGRAQVAALNVPGPEGRPLSLGAVATLREGNMAPQIVRAEKRRVVKISSDLAPGVGLGTAGEATRQAVGDLLPPGYRMQFINIFEKMVEAIDEFKTITFVAIVLTYLLLAALLESWTQPFLILTTVPFAYLGLFAALALTRMNMTILGLLGGVMLIGVVVNNAILIIDGVNQLRGGDGGMHRREAILQAAADKFRPIFMTSIAATLGMLPMALGRGLGSEIRANCGVGAVGGMVVSSLLSLYFVPLLYMVMGRRDTKPHPLRTAVERLRRRKNG
jgi:HAE1 family hydrophobic/amphiphilic exporter-1